MEEKNENLNGNVQKSTNGLAIAGFVVSLVSLFINFWGIVGLVGTILSAVGLSHVKKTNSGKGLAIAGLVIGIISIVYGIYVIIFLANTISTLL